ncbi:1,6-anhydro-N-acetylmuramyl-L-alanine amidase AmpD [Gallaecimonas sp. GXIMD4217]|uniref:1,6-anhydro-N-acetylmuramyl-L-alanine amidase AmpD n=1 Tax=Gallaecimonas sp. GXIMD4217 TaxID=3131927 RepID=UPI00311ADCDE
MDWYPKARRLDSPHHNERPVGCAVDTVVLHNISLPPNAFGTGAIEALFTGTLDPRAHPWFERLAGVEVSAHILIKRSGELCQFVPFSGRAWHAGRSSFQGRQGLNDNSIGVELEGADHLPFTDAQYSGLAELACWLAEHWALSPEQITAHETIAPFRKTDPGPGFDWQHFYGFLLETMS